MSKMLEASSVNNARTAQASSVNNARTAQASSVNNARTARGTRPAVLTGEAMEPLHDKNTTQN